MLSPIIRTSGNWKRWQAAASCLPTSYCSRSPLPLSPMTAKCSESGLFGSGTGGGGCPAIVERQRSAATGRLRSIITGFFPLFEGARHEIGNEVRVRVEQDQVVLHEPVLQLVGK